MSAASSSIDCGSTDELTICGPGGHVISSIGDWLAHAPPKKGELQWVDARSAKELAKAWLRDGEPSVPVALAELLATHDCTRGFRAVRATAELVTRLDTFRGEHRNHDLVVEGCARDSPTVICVEAKADEAFGGGSVESYYLDRSRSPKSKVPDRIRELVTAIFGIATLEPIPPDDVERYPGANGVRVSSSVGRLQYQLLTAVGGTLIEGMQRRADWAVLVVHEFLHEPDAARGLAGTQPRKVERNRRALEDLVEALPGSGERPLVGDFLVGPFAVPGGRFVPSDVPLLVGKVTTVLT